jgi:hypothetical protein
MPSRDFFVTFQKHRARGVRRDRRRSGRRYKTEMLVPLLSIQRFPEFSLVCNVV